jgi:hypothetical protein
MPPLTFDARQPHPPPPTRPEIVALLGEVRVQPATVYAGRVEKHAKSRDARTPAPGTLSASSGAKTGQKVSFGTKLKNFFRRLFGRRTN